MSQMRNKLRNEKILFIASCFILLSIVLMIAVIPGILNDTSAIAIPKRALTGIVLAIIIHVGIFILYVKLTRESRESNMNRRGEYIGVAILPIFFGLIYMDGAIAFLSHDDMLFTSILMFMSVLCDFVAASMMITLFFLKPQQVR